MSSPSTTTLYRNAGGALLRWRPRTGRFLTVELLHRATDRLDPGLELRLRQRSAKVSECRDADPWKFSTLKQGILAFDCERQQLGRVALLVLLS